MFLGPTGVGKTEEFIRLSRVGKKVVFIVPYLMLKFDIQYQIGDRSVFTLDSIRSGDKPHKLRHKLILQHIKKHNGDGAARAMKMHLAMAEEDLRQIDA